MKLSDALRGIVEVEPLELIQYGPCRHKAKVIDTRGRIIGYTEMGDVLHWDEYGNCDENPSLRILHRSEVFELECEGLSLRITVIDKIPTIDVINVTDPKYWAFAGVPAVGYKNLGDGMVEISGQNVAKYSVIEDVEIFVTNYKLREEKSPLTVMRIYTVRGEICYEII